MFAEVEYFAMLFVIADVAYKVCPLAVDGESAELFDVVDDRFAHGTIRGGVFAVLIAVQLCQEDFVCG